MKDIMKMSGIKSTFQNKKNKKIATDLLYSIGAIALMNIVLQFIAYPIVNRTLGETEFGNMLFWAGVISVLAPSFGQSVNNTRLVHPKRDNTQNGDYNSVLLLFSAISLVVVIIIGRIENYGWIPVVILGYVLVFSVFRNYSTVEYRLTLDYKRQFFFYAILSVGYVAGAFLCLYSASWFPVYIIGETLAVLYVVVKGSIYKRPLGKSDYAADVRKRCITLAGAYLLTNLMMNLDRFVLKFIVGEEAVSQYYVLSLIGKTIALIGGPLSSVIIGYISKEQYKLSRKQFGEIVLIMLGAGIIFWMAACVATPVFIYIFYPNLSNGNLGLNMIVNAAQILYFLTNLLLVVVLTICSEKWQFIIQFSYTIIFILLAVFSTIRWEVPGFSIAALGANLFYMAFTVSVGLKVSR